MSSPLSRSSNPSRQAKCTQLRTNYSIRRRSPPSWCSFSSTKVRSTNKCPLPRLHPSASRSPMTSGECTWPGLCWTLSAKKSMTTTWKWKWELWSSWLTRVATRPSTFTNLCNPYSTASLSTTRDTILMQTTPPKLWKTSKTSSERTEMTKLVYSFILN